MSSPATPTFINYNRIFQPSEGRLATSGLVDALIDRGAHDLNALVELKKKGWREECLDHHFEEQRTVADNAGPELSRIWFGRMQTILGEIDNLRECIRERGALKFLDLGCCPGGFTTYILEKNAQATGLGISLDVEKGGHAPLISADHLKRFDLRFADLTYYQLGPSKINGRRLQVVPFDIRGRTFDLALLDGHHLRTQVHGLPWDGIRLSLSQIILGLQSVKQGGTIVMKLSRPENAYSARILHMLDKICTNLSTCKPRTMHSDRGTFYAVAKGVGLGEEGGRLPNILNTFKYLWLEATFGGEEGQGRPLTEKDLDFIVTIEDLQNHYLDRLIQLGRMVWKIQEQGIHRLLQKKGMTK